MKAKIELYDDSGEPLLTLETDYVTGQLAWISTDPSTKDVNWESFVPSEGHEQSFEIFGRSWRLTQHESLQTYLPEDQRRSGGDSGARDDDPECVG